MDNKKNIAYVVVYDLTQTFCQLSDSLKNYSNSFFIISRKKDLDVLNLYNIKKKNILDLSITKNKFRKLTTNKKNKLTLKLYANKKLPYKSIYNASRFFYDEKISNVEAYAAYILTSISKFFEDNEIDYCYTETTDLVQLLSQLVCWKHNIALRSIALARIPSDRILLFNNCFDESIVNIQTKTSISRKFLISWLNKYKLNPDRPAYFKKITTYRSFYSLTVSLCRRSILLLHEFIGTNDINQLSSTYLIKFYFEKKLRFFSRFYKLIALKSINTSCDYVVYYLHVQPERSIDVISPFYCDQFWVINEIRKALPKKIKLYVKDHPSYDGGQPMNFYKKLNRLNNCELIHYSLDSRVIANNAIAVATISGTIGLEMALKNKPVLIFSDIFFSSLSNVNKYTNFRNLVDYFERLTCKKLPKNNFTNDVSNYLEHIFLNSVKTKWDGHFGKLNSNNLNSICRLILNDFKSSK